ncbi:MAG: hypothetical protein JJ920_05355 [Roseitalea sp.]|jgi:predicted transcriptional regulator|nr:hypothetical protein [Roseitalea sp.]MBO6722542.1 hypothetical protein [Roseitalea sp.]MBO6742316.1 hypothetical protein [Roseitalea sp.]
MKNVTISLDDDLYRRARILAAEEDTTVTAMLRAYLEEKTRQKEECERLLKLQNDTIAQIKSFSASGRLTREELYSELGDARFR